MQINNVKISCKEDVHIYCTDFIKDMKLNSQETTSLWKTYRKRLLIRTLKFEMPFPPWWPSNPFSRIPRLVVSMGPFSPQIDLASSDNGSLTSTSLPNYLVPCGII
jgi:hypothetical protein